MDLVLPAHHGELALSGADRLAHGGALGPLGPLGVEGPVELELAPRPLGQLLLPHDVKVVLPGRPSTLATLASCPPAPLATPGGGGARLAVAALARSGLLKRKAKTI